MTGLANGDQPRPSLHQTERITTPREQTPKTLDWLRKTAKDKLAPSPSHDSAYTTAPSRKNESKSTPESEAENSNRSRRKIKFSSMLGLKRHREKASTASPSTASSVSPTQPSTGPEVRTDLRRRSWWSFKKQRSTPDGRRDRRSVSVPVLRGRSSVPNEADDGVTWKNNGGTSRYLRKEFAKKAHQNGFSGTSKKPKGSSGKKQQAHRQTENIPIQPPSSGSSKVGREVSKTLGLKQQKRQRQRRTTSSSQTYPSTPRTSSTQGNAQHAILNDLARENLGAETPSPMTPTQVLRFFLGAGKSDSASKAGTQTDLANRETSPAASTSTLVIRRPSYETRVSGEHRARAWMPFWPSPRPQTELDQGENTDPVSRYGDYLEPPRPEVVRSDSASQKGFRDRVSRNGWRGG